MNDAPLDAVAKLPPLFADEADYEKFCCRHAQHQVEREALAAYNGKCYLGIDSGSTTLKMALLSEDNKLLWSYYSGNNGNPVQIAAAALKDLYGKMPVGAVIGGAAVTGYGEEMMKVAFGADFGEVETVAHLRGGTVFCAAGFLFDRYRRTGYQMLFCEKWYS